VVCLHCIIMSSQLNHRNSGMSSLSSPPYSSSRTTTGSPRSATRSKATLSRRRPSNNSNGGNGRKSMFLPNKRHAQQQLRNRVQRVLRLQDEAFRFLQCFPDGNASSTSRSRSRPGHFGRIFLLPKDIAPLAGSPRKGSKRPSLHRMGTTDMTRSAAINWLRRCDPPLATSVENEMRQMTPPTMAQ